MIFIAQRNCFDSSDEIMSMILVYYKKKAQMLYFLETSISTDSCLILQNNPAVVSQTDYKQMPRERSLQEL
jgi:hypothetical protein